MGVMGETCLEIYLSLLALPAIGGTGEEENIVFRHLGHSIYFICIYYILNMYTYNMPTNIHIHKQTCIVCCTCHLIYPKCYLQKLPASSHYHTLCC